MFHPLRIIGLLALTLTVTAGLTPAVAPPPRPLGPPEVQLLIDQMGDRDYRTRERAERLLAAEGVAALPLLRKALGHPDPEVRRRALRLVPGLEHAILVAPKRVTLIVKNQPIRVILEQLGKQTGYKIFHQGGQVGGAGMVAPVLGLPVIGKAAAAVVPKEPTYSYNFINEPFWDVVERLCRDCNLSLQPGWGDDAVRFNQGMGFAPHVGRDGAFRYSATGMQMWRNIDLNTVNPGHAAPANRQESLTLGFSVYAEPRLPFLGMNEVRIDAAYDNERNSMIPKNMGDPNNDGMPWGRFGRRMYYNGGGYKQTSLQGQLNLHRVSEKATMIKVVKGVIPMTLLVEQKPMSISDDILKAKGTKVTIGELEFHIEEVKKQANLQYEVKFTVTNKGNLNDYTWQNTLYQRMELLDAKGVKYQNWGTNWHGAGANNVTMSMTFNGTFGNEKPADAKRLVYQHWVTKQHDIAFEFRDVPLP